MALTPHKPNPANEEEVKQYEQALEDKKANPFKWATSPSLDTQVIQHAKEKREEIKKAVEKPTETPKKIVRKRRATK